MGEGVAVLRRREARCEAYRLFHRAAVDAGEWRRAAGLLRQLQASSESVSAFLPIAVLCTCAPTTAVVVHLCVQWGGCDLGLLDGPLRKKLCQLTQVTRSKFDSAYDAIVNKLDGGNVRAYGPSTFEYIYEARGRLTKQGLISAVRCCLLLSQTWSDQPASAVAARIIRDSSATGYAGNLVTLLLQKAGDQPAEQSHKRVRPPVEYEVERVDWMKRHHTGEK